jgi:hypothetical protein
MTSSCMGLKWWVFECFKDSETFCEAGKEALDENAMVNRSWVSYFE